MSPALELFVVSTTERLRALEPDWRALSDAHGLSVFQSYEWLAPWWRHVGTRIPGAELHVVVVREGARVVGIAPLFIQSTRAFGMLPVRRVSFLGREHSDFFDVLVAEDVREEVLRCLVDHFVENAHRFDVVALEELAARSPNADGLLQELQSRRISVASFEGALCPRTPLLSTWEQTLESFPVQQQREIKRRRRNLEKAGAVELEIRGDADTVDADLADVIAMHQERAKGGAGALSAEHLHAFHKDAARSLAERGALFIAFLRVNGTRMNAVYGFRSAGTLAVYLTGAREAGAPRRMSLGRVLLALCMEQAIAQGLTSCVFLRGVDARDHEPDHQLGAGAVPNRTFVWYGLRAAFPEERHRALLLGESLQRRAEREHTLWRYVSGRHGLASRAVVQHIGDRVGAVLRDSLAAARRPPAP